MVHIYNGILFTHKKRWSTAICDNMNGPWEYPAKQNKSGGKSQEPYDFHPCVAKTFKIGICQLLAKTYNNENSPMLLVRVQADKTTLENYSTI